MDFNNKFTHKNLVFWTLLVLVIFVVVLVVFLFENNRQAAPSDKMLTTSVKVFYVAINDGGKAGKEIGCGDSLVEVEVPIAPTSTPVQAALNLLFAGKSQSIGQSGLYNALYQSNLRLDNFSLSNNGEATIKISGITALGGVCDDPRFVAQIQSTILQFPTIKKADIFINNKPLADFLSEK